MRRGVTVEEVAAVTGVDPWFLAEMGKIVDTRLALAQRVVAGTVPSDLDRRSWRRLKRLGFSDAQLAYVFNGDAGPGGPAGSTAANGGAAAKGAEAEGTQRGPKAVTEEDIRRARLDLGVRTTFKTVDTCGAEFEAHTPYHYGTYEDEDEVVPSDRPRVIILGSGPNRIGQGIEFDYCCVHASFALQAAGYETIMLNCNPETVSTDYDTSDRLYFEPLTPEDLQNVLAAERDASTGEGRLVGVIVSLGGQTAVEAGRIPAP